MFNKRRLARKPISRRAGRLLKEASDGKVVGIVDRGFRA